jgi:hypothetical protein
LEEAVLDTIGEKPSSSTRTTARDLSPLTLTKGMAFRGKYPIRSKITVDNNSIIEQVSDFNYLGCNVTYQYEEDLNKKIKYISEYMGQFQES